MHYLNETTREVNILLVEDNPGDILLTTKALKMLKVANIVKVAKDGELAISMLKQEG